MPKTSFFKNSMCVAFSLFLIGLSSLLMVHNHFESDIKSQIQNVSVLKDIKYSMWGMHPNPSGSLYNQNFTLYSLQENVLMLITEDGEIKSVKSNITKNYEYNYKYLETSFAQGNSGRLNFINSWHLQKSETENDQTNDQITTLNLEAEKVYNYDFYAPLQRKFTILYNYILNTISDVFLVRFYALYVHKFFFEHKELVIATVFKPLGLSDERSSEIYDHPDFGFSSVSNFENWVRFSLRGEEYTVRTPEYEAIIAKLGLSEKEVHALIFQKSTLYNMIAALNSTIKAKAGITKSFGYKCSGDFCTNEELAALQIANGFLTTDPLFESLGLNMNIKDINTTFLADIEYGKFCEKNKDKFDCLPLQTMGAFFNTHSFGDFELMSLLWENQKNTEFIEDLFNLGPGFGESLVEYVKYLSEQFISKYDKVFAWAQTNYNNIGNVMTTYEELFLLEIYSRAFENKYLKVEGLTCEEYFTGDFETYKVAVCNSEKYNFVKKSVIRNYIKSLFFIDGARDQMVNDLKMTYSEIITFFKDTSKSKFAAQLNEINKMFSKSFGCVEEECSPKELFCLQWAQNNVFPNLPVELFPKKISSINEWDTQKLLKNFNPDYYFMIGEKISNSECKATLSSNSESGILNLFNLLKKAQGAATDAKSKNIAKYVSRSVIEVSFGGLLKNIDSESLMSGYKSNIILRKQKMEVSEGGAPWMNDTVQLVKTDNQDEIKNNKLEVTPQYHTINTGIYDETKTREITKVWGETNSSSKYTVYRGEKIDDEGKNVSVDLFQKYITTREVSGTNMLGFHPFIEEDESLKIFISQAYQPVVLSFDSNVEYKDEELKSSISAFKYNLVMSGSKDETQFIGIEELNQNYFSLSSKSYAIVEPITGLTLHLSLIYTIKAIPLTSSLLLSSTEPVPIYESEVTYKRKSLSEVAQVNSDISKRRKWNIALTVVTSACFAAFLVFAVLFYRSSRKYRSSEEKLLAKSIESM